MKAYRDEVQLFLGHGLAVDDAVPLLRRGRKQPEEGLDVSTVSVESEETPVVSVQSPDPVVPESASVPGPVPEGMYPDKLYGGEEHPYLCGCWSCTGYPSYEAWVADGADKVPWKM